MFFYMPPQTEQPPFNNQKTKNQNQSIWNNEYTDKKNIWNINIQYHVQNSYHTKDVIMPERMVLRG